MAQDEWTSSTASNEAWEPMYRGLNKKEDDARTVGDKDDVLDGYYLGSREVSTKNGQSIMHTIETQEGVKRDVWGTKMLTEELGKIRVGQYIRVQWHGKFPTKAGALIPEKKRGSTDSYQKWEVFINNKIAPMDMGGFASAKPSNKVAETKEPAQSEGPGVKVPDDDDSELPF